MLFAVIALIAAAPATGDQPICQNDRPQRVEGSAEGRLKRLDELPPANLVRAILRSEDGCSVPMIVRDGIGAPAERQR